MPYISTEALVGAGLLVVLAVGYQYMPTGAASGSANAKKNKKNKKKSKGAATPNEPQLTSVPLPPGPPSGQAKPAENGLKPETSANEPQLERPPAGPEPPTQPAQPVQPAAPKPKTLAEKIAPQPRKTKVDDMLAAEDLPATHARVMRVVDPSKPAASKQAKPAKPAAPPSPTISKKQVDEKSSRFVEDFASSDESTGAGGAEDDGWNIVAPKPKKPFSLSLSQSISSAPSSTPLPVSTKIQKKNAKKAEAKKEAKAAEEADRQRRLAMHKRDLERERINELYSSSTKTKTTQTGGRTTAGASVDPNGKLIWD